MVAVIFDRHAHAVLTFLTRRIGAAEAEDLLGEVFLTVMQRRHTFCADTVDSRPWLYGIASNLLYKRRRAEARFLRAVARSAQEQGLGILDDRNDSAVEERLDAQRTSARVSVALSELAARDREVLLLAAWAQLSQPEIATALNVPIGTVKSRLHRARRQLRASLMAVPQPHPTTLLEENGLCHG